jgi:1,4-alpha-glucan branching enzyme
MGNETLQSDEWSNRLQRSVDNPGTGPKTCFNWEELDPVANPAESHFHLGARACRRDLNRLYLKHPGLQNQGEEGIRRVHADTYNGVLCIHRKGGGQQFACIFNTSDHHFPEYVIPLPKKEDAPELDFLTAVREVYTTDARQYGGQGRTNGTVAIIRDEKGRATALKICLPPLTALLLEERFR